MNWNCLLRSDGFETSRRNLEGTHVACCGKDGVKDKGCWERSVESLWTELLPDTGGAREGPPSGDYVESALDKTMRVEARLVATAHNARMHYEHRVKLARIVAGLVGPHGRRAGWRADACAELGKPWSDWSERAMTPRI
jgi:hypothetical protein